MKQIIRLTESDLHRIVKESVQRILKEGRDSEQTGEINIADRVYDILSEDIGDENGQLEELIYQMENAGVFTIEFTIDTMDQTPDVLSMTDTDMVMEEAKKFINDPEILAHMRTAVDAAIGMIDDNDLHDNVENYWYDNYDFYGDSSNFLPRGV